MGAVNSLYDQDFYAWAMKNAELLRQRRFDEIDVEHIAEEIESVGKSERRELINRLAVLLAHLLKWQFQSGRRGRSWRLTIKEQRRQVSRVLNENPSLKSILNEAVEDAYATACLFASRECDLDEFVFPEVCPYAFEDILDPNFWPE